MEARYVFEVRFRVRAAGRVSIDPDTFVTRLVRPADQPGEPGWRFFRDNLWRGEIADSTHFRDMVDDALSVDVVDVEYRALETDEAYLDALESAIASDLQGFNADSVTETISKYLGSSIEVV
ncbi:MAG: LWR-salt protein [Halodesulfurarchaeum sp.]